MMQSLTNYYNKIQDYTIIYNKLETKAKIGANKPKNAWMR